MNNETILKKLKDFYENHYKGEYIHLSDYDYEKGYYGFIFSHKFAKAFWGEGEIPTGKFGEYKKCKNNCMIRGIIHDYGNIVFCPDCGEKIITEKLEHFETDPWIPHLQQMVLEENPLLYLKKFLDNE